ncbi:hypothetical protein DRE_05405 [Drechslerella stenobrocha 248]|uniref:Uncharacterized protein n=1 Tax=Drechslerella stenobrocha 248 TaxID=1043628 RepID=W7HZB7_9PEZI|nr:hypothetical protein DRE_05405 [Drechslerella stenobrocha 248]
MSAARALICRSRPAVPRPAMTVGKNTRHLHDITITRTGKPIYRQGGGRYNALNNFGRVQGAC